MGAWLGTGNVANHKRVFRTYDEAVILVQKLGLKSESEWRAYCQGKLVNLPPKPSDIPATPGSSYGKEFYQRGGMGAWLGTGTVAAKMRIYLTYDEAVKFVRNLNLKSECEWRAYCRGERSDLPPKPSDIPTTPGRSYGKEFYLKGGMGAWLGTGTVPAKMRIYRTYDEAANFVHKLKLDSVKEWKAYCRGEWKDLPSRPQDIPTNPNRVYKDEGWSGWGDWLGTGRVRPRLGDNGSVIPKPKGKPR
jgi:hypothetical protein